MYEDELYQDEMDGVRKPLDKLLNAVHSGYIASDRYLEALIRHMGKIPLCLYLGKYPEEQERFRELFSLSMEKWEQMDYQQAAALVRKYWRRSSRYRDYAIEAVSILALPFDELYHLLQEQQRKERKHCSNCSNCSNFRRRKDEAQ